MNPVDCPVGIIASLGAVLRSFAFLIFMAVLAPTQWIALRLRRVNPHAVARFFYGILVRIAGLKLRVHGARSDEASTLFVSNHTSYLDIPVLGALIPASFVAKAEVRKWPMIGTLAYLQQTVFVERRAVRAAEQQNALFQRLEAGKSLILFPEGTSTDSLRTLPFKSSLFGIVENGLSENRVITVQPVSVVCTEINGLPISRSGRPFYAWYGDMELVSHLWQVFKISAFTVDVIFHPPVTIASFGNRKALADYCQHQVARGVEQCLTGRIDKLLP